MKSLFSSGQMAQINAVAAKSKEVLKPVKVSKSVTSSQHEIEECNKAVLEYFKDSPAILITTREELHEYVLNAIEAGYCGIDTETTGLDRIRDTIVGFSLYYPGGLECYIPCRHLVPIFETLYPNQITYEDAAAELSLFLEAKTKLIFANADYDLAMIYKDFKLDLIPICYYDVILAWRCLKEDEKDNGLKQLYWKYPNKGQGSPKRFTDFFSPALFPYSDPNIAKLYAANDAKITYDLFAWQLPFVTKSNPQCKKHHLEKIADLVWNIEFPMIRVCAMMHRTGIYFDDYTCNILKDRYHKKYDEEIKKLGELVQEILDQTDALTVSKSPFKTGSQFNQASNKHMMYLLNKVLNQDVSSADKETLKELNLPITKQILNVRGVYKLLNTYIDKLPQEISPYDHRIHGTFNSIGASTGRMSSANPNLQQIPSHAKDIRHQFRATPQLERTVEQLSSGSALELHLFSYDALDTADNGWKDIIDLSEGEDIILYCGKNTCIGTIDCIQHTLPNTYIRISLPTSTPQSYKLLYREPPYITMSSDYAQQEPRTTAYVSQDPNMLKAFTEGKDIYATIASLAFNVPYERCLEHHPETHEYQPDGYARRNEAKSIVLGVTYGRSTKTIGDQLFGGNKQMTDDEKTAAAQKIYDAVLNAFPNLRKFMLQAQAQATKYGYVETILGRRRHIPDMQLPRFQFVPDSKYVTPDIDPLDPSTLKNKNEIPERIVKQLEKEFSNYKYFGQIVKATKRLAEEHIKVINNSSKITEASRKCVNSIIQGSAAELTKIALLKLFANKEWEEIGGRMLVPVHDELIVEVPLRNAEKGAQILSAMMQAAGNFFPFPLNCDVTTTYKWYGREYPCQYDMPESLDNMSALTPSNISWIQYHLVEMEYILPTIPNEDGTALKGDPAVGINGVMCEDIESDIRDYCGKYRIDTSEFINHIYQKVNGYIVENR